MRRRLTLLLPALALAATGADARVVSSGPNAFVIEHSVNVAAPHGVTWALVGQPSRWWLKDHTYSGNSANLTLEAQPGGCFCERLPNGGGIEHMRVAMVQPGEKLVMTGGLGPLLFEATAGVMEIEVQRAGGGSKLVMRYKAAGFASGNADKLAPLVDKVLGLQAQALARRAAGPR